MEVACQYKFQRSEATGVGTLLSCAAGNGAGRHTRSVDMDTRLNMGFPILTLPEAGAAARVPPQIRVYPWGYICKGKKDGQGGDRRPQAEACATANRERRLARTAPR